MRKVNHLIVHWTHSFKETSVDQIRRWHKGNGWRDIGYHRVILYPSPAQEEEGDWSQIVKAGRAINDDPFLEENERGAHTLYNNHDSVGLAIVGHSDYRLHRLQIKALKEASLILCTRFEIKPEEIKGHRDFNATECPGNEIYNLLPTVRKYVVNNMVPF